MFSVSSDERDESVSFSLCASVCVCNITGNVDSREFSSVVRGDLESKVMSEAAL